MKKNLLLITVITLSFFSTKAQVTQLNNNNSLHVQVALSSTKTIVVSSIDSTIWVTDATVPGTTQLSSTIKFEDDWQLLSGKLIFRGSTPATGSEIYITDGTMGGTTLVSDIVGGATGSDPGDMLLFNGNVYFSAVTPGEGRELWKTDGTSGNTSLVKDIYPGPQGSNTLNNYELSSNGTYMLFAARTLTQGIELWKSDGTTGGTTLLKDINTGNAGADSSNPKSFFPYGSLVLFVAKDATHGEEIWKTDGTTGGTVILEDINVGPGSSTTFDFFGSQLPLFATFHLFNNKVYFNATDGTSNGQIWSSDGTTTNLLKDVMNSFFSPVFLVDAVNLSNKFIFPVSDGTDISELWESDGTPSGTKIFKSYTFTGNDRSPFILVNFNFDISTGNISYPLFQGNKFFFTASTPAAGQELWVTDGVDSSAAHTTMVKDINSGTGDGVPGFSYLYTTTKLFFVGNDGTNGNELWQTDGTTLGTSMVQDINTEGDSDPELSPVNGGKIIFSATDGDNGSLTDLFVIDGNFIALPIKLSEFSVRLKDADALLQWTTTSEINTKDFIIQRSFDGQHFDNIGKMPAINQGSLKQTYYYTDNQVANSGKNIIYYRIISTDKNGKSITTNIIYVKIKGTNTWSVSLLTNPVQSIANVVLNNVSGDVELSIKDINGKTYYKTRSQVANGQINIPVTNLHLGMYILQADNNNERKTIKFIKQ